ncbi:VCBS repeat-containing protein [Chryseobacterium sp.]|uniref:FG-GAP repeat domain-containing protein n=1 Tax=Chryseobacterium sp. TaxID=1871047 RepID=UPI00321B654B
MKKLITVIILLLAVKLYSQLSPQSYYKKLFDSKGYNISVGSSTSADQLEFSWGVPAHMEALILMYEKTKDNIYAKTLIECIGNTIDRRDDLRFPVLGWPAIYDYRGISGAAWSTSNYNEIQNSGDPHSHLVHSANITYPMAKFAAIVRDDPSIQNLTYPKQGRYYDKSYSAIADDLIQKVNETLDYHADQWNEEIDPISNDTIGYYKERDNDTLKFPGVVLPFNMQSTAGRVFVQMYQATHQTKYLKKLNKLANFIKSNTSVNSSLGSNTWKYWNHTDLRDDISHAGLTASFPYECYKYNIKNSTNDTIYTSSDMEKYVNTFTKDIYQKPLYIKNGVNYNGLNWNIKYHTFNDAPPNPNIPPPYDGYISYMWLYLSSEHNQLIYQIIADLQAAENYYKHINVEDSSLTIALLANHENLIVPVNTEHGYGEASDWRGVAKGKFDGGSDDQFVVLRNFDGLMGTMKPVNKGFDYVTNSRVCGDISYNWKGLAAGDFFGDNKSEIIALSDHPDSNKNGFYIYKIENNQIIENAQFTGFGNGSGWVGVAAGNFISGGKDDIITVRNYNKEVRVYKFNGVDPEMVYFNQLNLPANSKIKAVAAGNLDQDTKDEIVLLIDADDHMQNGVYVYDIDDNGVLTLIDKSIGFGSASDWKGLAVGDLDGDGIAEIIAHRNFDGEYKLFKLTGGYLSNPFVEKFPISQTNDNVMCFGNFDPSSQNEELVTLRKDGGIVMFSAAKVLDSINKSSKENKNSDPCKDETPSLLFSFLKP